MRNSLKSIQERMYNLYDLPEAELDELLYKTYTRRDSFAMVIKVSKYASRQGLYDRQYNELRLTLVRFPDEHWLNLTLYSIDDAWWRAILPMSLLEDNTLEDLWDKVQVYLPHNLTQKRFREFTKDYFGATEYDWN